MIMAQWGQRDRLVADPDVWLCHQCNDCTTYCPRGARPGDVLAAIRTYVYENFAFPSFMGKALATPSALPFLILVPAIIMFALMWTFAPKNPDGSFMFMTSETIDFNLFLPHSTIDAFFVLGNIFIFLFALIGFKKFWNALNANGYDVKMGFIPALIKTATEILSHKLFNKCEANKSRSAGHMMLLFGFIGAMFTTGAVFIFIFIPHYLNMLGLESLHQFFELPLNLPHPVKILGALSGISITIGGILLIARRMANKDQVGANGYADYLSFTRCFWSV